MKLPNCDSLEIEEFFGSSIPKRYATLSHTWEADEATFQEVGNLERMNNKQGWVKIRQACRIAQEHRCPYIWIDTCCINKWDFSELTEAINSMFKWYAGSSICLAYLEDIELDLSQSRVHFQESRWFTRGWTLQELIAPPQVYFYDKNWEFFGSRYSLAEITGTVLESSWAAGRQTTREEDIAYCLLGIVGVYMPLFYGEGDRTFIRLQEEIIKASDDASLFAWVQQRSCPGQAPRQLYCGVLAKSPDEFAHFKRLEIWPRFRQDFEVLF
ncbi:Vegetative incompatibility protein HET-E-1-like protein 8 [Colletotrichum chlorophyti]|uniref:Vegetative incompatibility protein HET-E-1-like protein 8 n=1 Tax=Colletotrichum chlorophyti TaxID=708187 RepID=A0A1Q8RGA0_9PEZI|nr:Vegetative incompatibility protein HET-E-1-like protein 8 [Colletotrichum chlorophyti]